MSCGAAASRYRGKARLLREFRNLYLVRLQQATGRVVNRRNRNLIIDLRLQEV